MNEGQLLFPSSTFATDGNDKVLSTNWRRLLTKIACINFRSCYLRTVQTKKFKYQNNMAH
jgi:hypothetical protein